MRFKPKEIGIPPEEPFRHCALQREEHAEVLTQFVSTLQEPFVLAIDSAWGSGKSTFIKMWRKHLIKQRYTSLYFNAWENDFAADPLVAFIGEMSEAIELARLDDKEKGRARELFEKTVSKTKTMLFKGLPLVLKHGTGGVVDFASDEAADDFGNLLADFASKSIDNYLEGKKGIADFRDELSNFVKSLSTEEDRKPLVFFVDELDRCRPTYAIELLERIKHLFNIEGIVFVLAMDKSQLQHSIKAVYGQDFCVDGYLRRFIDMNYNLPEPNLADFVEYLYAALELDEDIQARSNYKGAERHSSLKRMLSPLLKLLNFSLRETEQLFSTLNVVLRTTPPDFHFHPELLAILLVLYSKKRSLYTNYINGQAGPKEVMDQLAGLLNGEQYRQSKEGTLLESLLVAGLPEDSRFYSASLSQYKATAHNERESEIGQRAERIVKTIVHFSRLDAKPDVKYLAKKIELASMFHFTGDVNQETT